jgi:hypothetical protein
MASLRLSQDANIKSAVLVPQEFSIESLVMFTLRGDGTILRLRAEGILSAGDYSDLAPRFEERIATRHGPMLMLLELPPSFGWTVGGLWRDHEFDFHHWNSFARVAVLGHRHWHRWITIASKLLFNAEVRFFWARGIRIAEEWLLELARNGRAVGANASRPKR